jgi:F-type H+-transporting ATPase subunit delta
MIDKKISRNYATALFGLALERKELEEVHSDMVMIHSLLKDHPELRQVLTSPVIGKGKKSAIMHALLKERVRELSLRFLDLLISSLRVVYLSEIGDSFFRQYKEHHGIVPVTITSAVPVTDAIRKRLTQQLAEDLQAQIELQERVDDRLIGGIVVQVGDMRYDSSLRAKLDRIDRQFNINIYKRSF